MDNLIQPVAQARPLSETVGTSDLDQMLRDYVKPSFLRMSADKRQKAIEVLKQMAEEA
jgi:hypothetical protein